MIKNEVHARIKMNQLPEEWLVEYINKKLKEYKRIK